MSREVVSEVVAVARDDAHRFSKPVADEIRLLTDLGVAGDSHAGRTVQHRSRVRRDPTQPNLRQVHLVGVELLDRLAAQGFRVAPGVIGENVTTRGVDLLALPAGARLRLGDEAVVVVQGLRNPCGQLDGHQRGLTAAVLGRAPDGSPVRLAGVMGTVERGGPVRPGDPIVVELPDPPHARLAPV